MKTMESSENYTFVIIGQGTLAVRCCQFLLSIGIHLEVVMPLDSVFLLWAKKEGLKCLNTIQDLESLVSNNSVEWLFSISNPIILTSALLDNIKLGAFNYHDAPLPKYAGTHATSWALFAMEDKYAVTWHRIATVVDAGDIAVQQNVEINRSDTALSLNMKCYNAAFEGFKKLISLIKGGKPIEYVKQNVSERSFFSSRKRPYAGACLQWEHSAEELSALVRGLSFGERYRNPLCVPKVYLINIIGIVKTLEVLSVSTHKQAGILVDIAQNFWIVTTGTTDIRIEFIQLTGEDLRADFLADMLCISVGDSLPIINNSDLEDLTQEHEELAPYESFWVNRLESFRPLNFKFDTLYHDLDCIFEIYYNWNLYIDIENVTSEERLVNILGAFVVYLALVNDVQYFHLDCATELPKHEVIDYSIFFSASVPFEFNIDFNCSALDLYSSISVERSILNKFKTFHKDIICRYPQLRSTESLYSKYICNVRISIIDFINSEVKPAVYQLYEKNNASLTMQIDPVKGAFRWISNSSHIENADLKRMADHIISLDRLLLSNPNLPLKSLLSQCGTLGII
ncbi:formyltransferase family protein [Xenorhabdus bovienii]|uniref:formyltransferase family protein n=1 Tax=Xenorhabdus bovienii TaxID=40576 RepID=UPI00237C720F|nr:formyltransferase family protein [Xenorhabdus bovienii]MDE1486879.1 hypothetical protein [Xenorhabdus bovienii]MDE1495905.1 hypothetical protein [Xenorhabdus bovienii]MDE9461189.1 hypothetical protein [Xenorhabdus bovienii]MDE9469494.1 hypothetical protein [Xenorhabdus bovienii]MDE9473810.1 hypothetical protein [Xenorhabdus bovienii]